MTVYNDRGALDLCSHTKRVGLQEFGQRVKKRSSLILHSVGIRRNLFTGDEQNNSRTKANLTFTPRTILSSNVNRKLLAGQGGAGRRTHMNERQRFNLAAKPLDRQTVTHLHLLGEGKGWGWQADSLLLHGWEIAGEMKRLHAFKLSGAKLPRQGAGSKEASMSICNPSWEMSCGSQIHAGTSLIFPVGCNPSQRRRVY